MDAAAWEDAPCAMDGHLRGELRTRAVTHLSLAQICWLLAHSDR